MGTNLNFPGKNPENKYFSLRICLNHCQSNDECKGFFSYVEVLHVTCHFKKEVMLPLISNTDYNSMMILFTSKLFNK